MHPNSSRCPFRPPTSDPAVPHYRGHARRRAPNVSGETRNCTAGSPPQRSVRTRSSTRLARPGPELKRWPAAGRCQAPFGETRRRAKVIGRLPGETSCISLVWAVLDRSSRAARGFTMTPTGLRLLQDLRRTLLEPPTPLRHPEPTPAAEPDTAGAVA
jgi:hypothetical protein